MAKKKNVRIISAEYGDQNVILMFYKAKGENDYWTMDVVDAKTKEVLQTLATPFDLVTDIGALSYVQSFDVVFFASGRAAPCKLVRNNATGGGYEWSFETQDMKPFPVLEWNDSSEHIFKFTALPDSELVNVDEEGNRYYPKGSVRQVDSETAKDTLPRLKFTGVSIVSSNSVRMSVEAQNGFLLVPGTTLDITSMAFAVYFAMVNVGGTSSNYPVFTSAYNGWKNTTTTEFRDDGDPCLGVTLYPAVVTVLSTETVEITTFTSEKTDKFRDIKFSSSPNGMLYPIYVGYGADFWIAKVDAPATIKVSDLNYWQPYSGGEAEFVLQVDQGNELEGLAIGDFLALKTKNSLFESEMLSYDAMPFGTTYPLQNPPVEVQKKLDSKTDSNNIELRPESGGGYGYASSLFPIRGEVTFKTEGLWSGVLELQEYTEDGNLSTIATISSENGNSNTELTREIVSFGSSVRVACVRREHAYKVNRSVKGDGGLVNYTLECDEGCQWTLSATGDRVVYMEITGKRDLSDGRAVYLVKSYGGAMKEFTTDTYALGAWGATRKYPKCVGIYQERMVYAASEAKPTTLWLSRTNDWGDFEDLGDDVSAISMTMQTEKYDEIKWMKPIKTGITIGTRYGEYIFGESNGGVVTADNGRFLNASNIGSAECEPEVFGVALMMVKTGGEEIHRIDYNTLSEESAGTNVSLYASHLFEGDEIVDLFAVRSPTNTMFALTASGKLATLTYEPSYNVTGWGCFEILDGVECAVPYRQDGKDILAMIVKNGDAYVLGELDLRGDVWTDDGEKYESLLTPVPFAVGQYGAYGYRLNIAGVDVYTTEGTEFYAKLAGGTEVRCDRGFDVKGSKRPLMRKTTLAATSGWEDEATITIRTDYEGPLEIAAVGVCLRKGRG